MCHTRSRAMREHRAGFERRARSLPSTPETRGGFIDAEWFTGLGSLNVCCRAVHLADHVRRCLRSTDQLSLNWRLQEVHRRVPSSAPGAAAAAQSLYISAPRPAAPPTPVCAAASRAWPQRCMVVFFSLSSSARNFLEMRHTTRLELVCELGRSQVVVRRFHVLAFASGTRPALFYGHRLRAARSTAASCSAGAPDAHPHLLVQCGTELLPVSHSLGIAVGIVTSTPISCAAAAHLFLLEFSRP